MLCRRQSVVYVTSPVHLDMDGGLAGVNLEEGGLGLMKEADEVKAGLGQGQEMEKPRQQLCWM